jgi:toluene monooxygenase system ferredoxin subunit
MMAFVRVAALDDLWRGEMRGYQVGGCKLLLARLDDAVYAYEDRCAHLGVQLSKGSLDGHVLTCSAHQWQYDLCTGGGVNPASARLRSFPVRIERGDIFVDVGEVTR